MSQPEPAVTRQKVMYHDNKEDTDTVPPEQGRDTPDRRYTTRLISERGFQGGKKETAAEIPASGGNGHGVNNTMTIILYLFGFFAVFYGILLVMAGGKAISSIFYGIKVDREIARLNQESARIRKHTEETERATEQIYHCIALDYDLEFRKKHQKVENHYYIDKAVILKGDNDGTENIVQPIDCSYERQ